jgi:TolB-like protein
LSYLVGRIPANSTVAILNFQSDYPNLSEYIIDDITSGLVNTDLFTMVDRRSLDLLAQELAFQLSGEVSDETALAVGKKLGAQTVISGAVTYLGEFYRLRVQAIEIETARLQGSLTITVGPGRLLTALTGNPWTGSDTPDTIAAPEDIVPDITDTKEPVQVQAPAKTERAAPAPVSDAKFFYLGLRGGFSTHFYQINTDFLSAAGTSALVSFSGDFAAQMSLQIFNFLALQVEAVFFTGDSLEMQNSYPLSLSYSAMMLPALAKITFRPGLFLFAGFGGIYFTVPLGAMTINLNGQEYSYNYTASMGFIAGGNIGVKLGPGTLFLDIRYAGDFGDIEVQGDWGSRALYKRSLIFCSLGYEFGIGSRKRK